MNHLNEYALIKLIEQYNFSLNNLFNLQYQGYTKIETTNLEGLEIKPFLGKNLIVFDLDSSTYHLTNIQEFNIHVAHFGLNQCFLRIIGHLIKD